MTIFSQDQLAQIVKDSLVNVPAGHTNAVVATVDQSGVKIVAGFSLHDDRWRIEGAYAHDWDGEDTAGAKVILSW